VSLLFPLCKLVMSNLGWPSAAKMDHKDMSILLYKVPFHVL